VTRAFPLPADKETGPSFLPGLRSASPRSFDAGPSIDPVFFWFPPVPVDPSPYPRSPMFCFARLALCIFRRLGTKIPEPSSSPDRPVRSLPPFLLFVKPPSNFPGALADLVRRLAPSETPPLLWSGLRDEMPTPGLTSFFLHLLDPVCPFIRTFDPPTEFLRHDPMTTNHVRSHNGQQIVYSFLPSLYARSQLGS